MTEEFVGGHDVCLGGEELIEQAVVQFGIEVGAAVFDYDEAIVGVLRRGIFASGFCEV